MRQYLKLDRCWILHVQIPYIGTTRLITHSQDLLPVVHGESNEPDLTVFVVQSVEDSHVGFVDAKCFVLKAAWLPTYDAVLAGLTRGNKGEHFVN